MASFRGNVCVGVKLNECLDGKCIFLVYGDGYGGLGVVNGLRVREELDGRGWR